MAERELRPLYETSGAFTITLDGLPSSPTLVAGRQGVALRNDRDTPLERWMDFGVSAIFQVGAGPTTDTTIEFFMAGTLDDEPKWPKHVTGLDAAITLDNTGQKWGLFPVVGLPVIAAGEHNVRWTSMEAIFGGLIPHRFAPVVIHNTGVNFATAPTPAAGIFYSPMRLRSVDLP